MNSAEPMTRERRTEEELRKASDHLYYEFWMFTELARTLGAGVSETVIKNAVIESFVIHARVLLDFLYSKKSSRQDDVIAEDFFEDPLAWTNNRPDKSERVKDVHRRAGGEVAHLSYRRQDVTPEKKPWNFAAITVEVEKVFGSFSSMVSPGLLGNRWQGYQEH